MSHTVFDVKSNCLHFGKAYAFYAARERVGTIRAAFLLWVALHMIRHDAASFGINY